MKVPVSYSSETRVVGALSRAFDWVCSEKHRRVADRAIVILSVAGYLLHLAMVFLARWMAHPPAAIEGAGTNFLFAIYTPFSIILLYEILLLIIAIPRSTTQSMALQFEIASLIFVRDFFKEIAALDMTPYHTWQELKPALVEGVAGLFMFFLVTVFRRLAHRRTWSLSGQHAAAASPPTHEAANFVVLKKALALLLLAAFVGMALKSFVEQPGEEGAQATFYAGVFTLMIITDVLILILSLGVSDRYELVFRNAAFVIAVILIRFSITTGYPVGPSLAIAGMSFGIATLAIYNFNLRSFAHAVHPG